MAIVTTTNTVEPKTSAGTRTLDNAQKSLNTTYQDFLRLLTTQLKNQDPSQPLDTNQLTSQIAQLSQVEQQLNTNRGIEQLVALYNGTHAASAVSYIGKQVDATGNQTELVKSQATVVYTLPKDAKNVKVTVTNSAGTNVFSADGTSKEGRNQLLWNGATTGGTTAPDGVYTFKVTAKDSAGKDLTVATYTTGIVTSVDTKDGVHSLTMGKLSVPLDTVNSIYTAGTNPNA